MITKITGRLVALAGDTLTLAVGAYEYEVLIPEFTRRQLQDSINKETSLHTIEYFEGDPTRGRLTPRMVGFTSGIEREFFELFCQVDGVGVKKALRAMVRPVQEVAMLIEDQDAKGLAATSRYRPGDRRTGNCQIAAKSTQVCPLDWPRHAGFRTSRTRFGERSV